MYLLGLTGSIGMGKSTTAQMFADLGCAVWDADAAVHRLYSQEGAAITPMSKTFPSAIVDGSISRNELKRLISEDPSVLKKIETIVHPLVLADRKAFMATAQTDIAVFDIPLLFETGADQEFDAVACVVTDPNTQRDRVLARGTMTQDQFEHIVSKQMPAKDKADRADHVIRTDSLAEARRQVESIVTAIRKGLANA